MKTYCYNEPIYDGPCLIGNDIIEMTEQQILEEYWGYWSSKMKTSGKLNLLVDGLTEQNCIDDWVVVNWAWEKHNANV